VESIGAENMTAAPILLLRCVRRNLLFLRL